MPVLATLPVRGRVRKYIGAYYAALDGQVDALIFSAGIGENSALVRGLIVQGLQVRGEAGRRLLSRRSGGGGKGQGTGRCEGRGLVR